MPRIQRPADLNVTSPREYALLAQIAPTSDSDIDASLIKKYQELYGSDAALPSKETISFDEFSALFVRPKTVASGEGDAVGLAATAPDSGLAPIRFTRRATRETDVRIQVTHASICHSDIHQVRNEWHGTTYPILPGHEIVGIVIEVGSKVTGFKVGDKAGVGCMVGSCKEKDCGGCAAGNEQYCRKGMVATYNGIDPIDGSVTKGGYSSSIVVREDFVLRIPDNLPLEGASPLLCAGVTTWSPIKHFDLGKPGLQVGVVGLGGLGAHAVKFLASLGSEVTVISTSASKEKEAKEGLGAKHFIVSKDEAKLKAAAGSLDAIINTVSAQHDLGALINLLRHDGQMVCVGAPEIPPTLPTFSMLFRRLSVAGSLIGGIKETQEMLDFCAAQSPPLILPYETVDASGVNEAYERILASQVKYRVVINVQGSLIA